MPELHVASAGTGPVTIAIDGHRVVLSREAAGQVAGFLLAAAHGATVDHSHAQDKPQLVAVPTAPKPIPVPRPAPTPATSALWSADAVGCDEMEPGFTAKALQQMSDEGINRESVLEVVHSPVRITPARFGDVENYRGDELSVLVAKESWRVVGVARYPSHDPSNVRSPSGGSGRKMPGTGKELRRAFERAGFCISFQGNDHLRAVHPAHPSEQITLPNTPIDGRGVLNVIQEAKRRTGIDVTAAS
ncbi:hypothetical protein EDF62_3348 [Leucobacter luti]|uniref:Uncharacterized protein n=1 Tax=Leucobacter luti TaxID=340320 RepID=A0A4R6RS91_9MICO|nr:hypothetical protein [Leucobacter luti]TDP89594.1 hypothetical protein EDF62_3348 [Leucobacter luti]